MSSFSITRKKTPFQKHKEEEEARKKVRPSIPPFRRNFFIILVSMSSK